jgi:hypothetical protein
MLEFTYTPPGVAAFVDGKHPAGMDGRVVKFILRPRYARFGGAGHDRAWYLLNVIPGEHERQRVRGSS